MDAIVDCYDIFGYMPQLSVFGRQKYHTKISVATATLFYLIILGYFIFQVQVFQDEAHSGGFQQNDVFSPLTNNQESSQNMSEQHMAVSYKTSKPFDPRIGKVVFLQKTRNQTGTYQEELQLEDCTLDHFNETLKEELENFKFPKEHTCFAKGQHSFLTGKWTTKVFQTLEAQIIPCDESKQENISCITDEDYLGQYFLEFNFTLILQLAFYNETDPHNPLQYRIEDYRVMIDPKIRKIDQAFLYRVKAETTTKWYPLCSNMLSSYCEGLNQQTFLDYKALMSSFMSRNESQPFYQLVFQLSDYGKEIKRRTFNISDLIASIGGVFTSTYTLLFIANTYNKRCFISEFMWHSQLYKKNKIRSNQVKNVDEGDPENQINKREIQHPNSRKMRGEALLENRSLFQKHCVKDLFCCTEKQKYFASILRGFDIVKVFKLLLLAKQVKRIYKGQAKLELQKQLSKLLNLESQESHKSKLSLNLNADQIKESAIKRYNENLDKFSQRKGNQKKPEDKKEAKEDINFSSDSNTEDKDNKSRRILQESYENSNSAIPDIQRNRKPFPKKEELRNSQNVFNIESNYEEVKCDGDHK